MKLFVDASVKETTYTHITILPVHPHRLTSSPGIYMICCMSRSRHTLLTMSMQQMRPLHGRRGSLWHPPTLWPPLSRGNLWYPPAEARKAVKTSWMLKNDSDSSRASLYSGEEAVDGGYTSTTLELSMTEGHDLALPRASLHDRIRDYEIARERGSLPQERAAPANGIAEHTIQLWLIDTGCGHDLLSRRELTAVKDMV